MPRSGGKPISALPTGRAGAAQPRQAFSLAQGGAARVGAAPTRREIPGGGAKPPGVGGTRLPGMTGERREGVPARPRSGREGGAASAAPREVMEERSDDHRQRGWRRPRYPG